MSAARRGRVITTETRARLSAARAGKILSPEHRAAIASAKRGKTLSAEHRANIGSAQLGRKMFPEAIAKRVAAYTANRQRKAELTRDESALCRLDARPYHRRGPDYALGLMPPPAEGSRRCSSRRDRGAL